jgi:tetratricopeptide (TPR) repeat protein
MLAFDGKETFDERVNIILDEVALGIQWERSSLILVIYSSEHIKNLVEASLIKSFEDSGQVVVHYAVDKSHYDIPLEFLEHPRHEQAIFFVSGLRRGGGQGYSNAYRALNMHRENLIEGNIKAIFWLTKNEAKQLARFSPDFWAFRHKVVEFLDLPSLENNKNPGPSLGSFHTLYKNKTEDFQAWIKPAERYYALGCIEEAMLNFRKALRKYPEETAIGLQIADILLSTGQLAAAIRILKKLKKQRTIEGNLLIELERLNRRALSIRPVRGGFLEQSFS